MAVAAVAAAVAAVVAGAWIPMIVSRDVAAVVQLQGRLLLIVSGRRWLLAFQRWALLVLVVAGETALAVAAPGGCCCWVCCHAGSRNSSLWQLCTEASH